MDSDREMLMDKIMTTLEGATLNQLLLVERFCENIVR